MCLDREDECACLCLNIDGMGHCNGLEDSECACLCADVDGTGPCPSLGQDADVCLDSTEGHVLGPSLEKVNACASIVHKSWDRPWRRFRHVPLSRRRQGRSWAQSWRRRMPLPRRRQGSSGAMIVLRQECDMLRFRRLWRKGQLHPMWRSAGQLPCRWWRWLCGDVAGQLPWWWWSWLWREPSRFQSLYWLYSFASANIYVNTNITIARAKTLNLNAIAIVTLLASFWNRNKSIKIYTYVQKIKL